MEGSQYVTFVFELTNEIMDRLEKCAIDVVRWDISLGTIPKHPQCNE